MYPLTKLNPIELNYFLFMISLDKSNGNFNVIDDILPKWTFFDDNTFEADEN